VRQQLARLYSFTKLGQWNAQRAKAEAQLGVKQGANGGGGGQSIANLGKITQTAIVKTAARLGTDILGADAMLAAPDGAEHGRFSAAMVFSPASSIYGGTDEIQHDIIAEKALGLPREPRPDRGQAYGEFVRSLRRE
jgi:alkylation response protein AidB-like acyl-CoA dehydrogenase